jgi:hypothetical protein
MSCAAVAFLARWCIAGSRGRPSLQGFRRQFESVFGELSLMNLGTVNHYVAGREKTQADLIAPDAQYGNGDAAIDDQGFLWAAAEYEHGLPP